MSERATVKAHRVVTEVVREGVTVIDATAGNGHDTVFLAGLVGPRGKVLAFDVQEAAIVAARKRVEAAGFLDRVEFFRESHGRISEHVGAGEVAAVMFNLGYLPGADHAVITETEETLKGIAQGRAALREGGVMTVVCYPGHCGGDAEAAAVVEFARDHGGEIFSSDRKGAPFLVVMRRSA